MEQNSESKATPDQEDLKGTFAPVTERTEFPLCSDANSDSKQDDKKDFESKEENDKTPTNSPAARVSPEPSCAICLGQLQNKSFTDSCFHTFCFTCLVEWSKVKAECPLCKQRFKSIVHNVRSIEDYDQYYIVSRSSESSWRSQDGRRFMYSSTLTSERIVDMSRQRRITATAQPFRQSEIQMHRLVFAPHTVSFHPSTTISREDDPAPSIAFRRRIYNTGLWVKRACAGSRVRCTSPEFYRQNPACTHRLIPWLTRELNALLHNSETRVMFVMDLILALIMRYDIRSQEFYVHMQPYLGDRMSHFVHEFFNYASSPFDMTQYDIESTYELLENFESSVVYSSPGSDVVPISSSPGEHALPDVPSTSEPSTSQSSSSGKATSKKQRTKGIKKLYLKRNQANNSWNVLPVSPPVASCSTSQTLTSSLEIQSFGSTTNAFVRVPVIGNSESSRLILSSVSSPHGEPTVANISSDDDECVIVNVVKPRSQRTPEIIDLIDSSDNETTGLQQLNGTLVSDPESILGISNGLEALLRAMQMPETTGVIPSTSNESSVRESHRDNKKEKSKKRSKGQCKDVSKRKRRKNANDEGGIEKRRLSQASSSINSSSTIDMGDENSSTSSWSCSRDTVLSSFSYVSHAKEKERSTCRASWYSDSTDISDSACINSDLLMSTTTEKVKKKRKLRSVVAQVSNDRPVSHSDSSHHSPELRKKSKEKRRKKRKHDRHKRHRRRSHSKDKRDSREDL